MDPNLIQIVKLVGVHAKIMVIDDEMYNIKGFQFMFSKIKTIQIDGFLYGKLAIDHVI